MRRRRKAWASGFREDPNLRYPSAGRWEDLFSSQKPLLNI